MDVNWKTTETAGEWFAKQDKDDLRKQFSDNGYVVVHNLLDNDSLEIYQEIYDKLLSGEIDASKHRHDLGSHEKRKVVDQENVCQIMWPSVYLPGLAQGPLHQRTKAIANVIIGEDAEFDFDMLIAKSPHTETGTPWHQDESYWPDMPDKRAVSFWCAMDDATVENGCMWFVSGSHKRPLRTHRPVKVGHHIRMTDDCSEAEGQPQPIPAGSCTGHHGRTLHYTRGNSTDRWRRAFIVNYRPKDMVAWEREHNFDHGKESMESAIEEVHK
ncbi:phytanoyl-CoA dioxygenase domain-containing protein 1 homolog [Lingula anatina]|uniref:Phytanoyl-CoA dioxygenase domain-containing protein 1 homolog n=1 Tax=Lingula anatina TaxID=7574 RepID=A0A1S3JNQ5_LINAN|nr:phytanoyl-CoA dioxygenase domain-containing protein 1 homolog [Lingula anatina]|eukprot:XP_013411609.1 phytanoyl-CoA dioxygenase domain-containing protein 1 homolog [Lingula anatina]